MKPIVLRDPSMDDAERRRQLYEGALLVYSPRPTTLALRAFALELCQEAFRPLDPEVAQHELPVERYAAILAELKPRFIHHPESKRLICALLDDLGCDPTETYFDVPRLRTSTADRYLTTGIAFAFHPHRDSWYSAPLSQLNWWLAISEISSENGISFYPGYWDAPLRNGSVRYDYARWNAESRKDAAKHIYSDTRDQPRPEEPVDASTELRPELAPGALVLFSAAQLHASVPNTSDRTRLSIDFRTVNRRDVENRIGAPNTDSSCSGTSLRDFLRRSDLAKLPESLAGQFDGRLVPELLAAGG